MRERVRKVFTQPSRTKQAFKQECDINQVMKKFKKVNGYDYLSRHADVVYGNFGDFSDVPTLLEARERIIRAEEAFGALPSQLRKRFSNDPAQFLDFVHDPKNEEEMRALGLLNPKSENSMPLETKSEVVE